MTDTEGVIKYQLDHQVRALDSAIDIGEINAWRRLFYRLQLIGQSEGRYDGLGFGNISVRLPETQGFFLITGTQTGHLAILKPSNFAVIQTASPASNYLRSLGPCQPSSEALTHASVYQHAPSVNAVIHGHCPEIWRNTHTLSLAHTSSTVAYGTVAMATAVEDLFKTGEIGETGIFSMLGHEDGIIALGPSIAAASMLLLKTLADAFAVEQESFDL